MQKISIKNWKKFQHFKDRRPPWIKLYRELLDDPDWHELDGESAKVLVMIWLIASENENGDLPSMKKLAFRLRLSEIILKSTTYKLKNWLDISTISARYQVDIPETETETETETEITAVSYETSVAAGFSGDANLISESGGEISGNLVPTGKSDNAAVSADNNHVSYGSTGTPEIKPSDNVKTQLKAIKKPEEAPHREIIDLYHEILPMLSIVKIWHKTRQSALNARWNEYKEYRSIDWWREFFEKIAKSDFLTGRTGCFKATLDWIINQTNFIKILEDRYENRPSKLTKTHNNNRPKSKLEQFWDNQTRIMQDIYTKDDEPV